ncbi:helix-turn-helix domain-containing protein [Pricia sp.]|uniref:helix-turn-helix domain-containing protein n=1 Tax=Pricia sp. TaxID=2268138 RepID=UPI0035938679
MFDKSKTIVVLREISVTPKNFTRIIQFQNSKRQMSGPDTSDTMDVVFENGVTDLSHFIKTFKKFTGMTPSEFQYLPDLALG